MSWLGELFGEVFGAQTDESCFEKIRWQGCHSFEAMPDSDQLNVAAHFGFEWDYDYGRWVVSSTPHIIQGLYDRWRAQNGIRNP